MSITKQDLRDILQSINKTLDADGRKAVVITSRTLAYSYYFRRCLRRSIEAAQKVCEGEILTRKDVSALAQTLSFGAWLASVNVAAAQRDAQQLFAIEARRAQQREELNSQKSTSAASSSSLGDLDHLMKLFSQKDNANRSDPS